MGERVAGLYAIADAGALAARGVTLRAFAEELRAAQVQTVQWRCKDRSARDVLDGAAELRNVFAGSGCRLIMNDRADLALLAGFHGVHVGQGDLSPEEVRKIVGQTHSSQGRDAWGTEFLVGVSTHTEAEVRAAESGSAADYVAVGPVFQTGSKADAAPAVGLEGVQRARALTTKPLVAIGGITRENAGLVREAGADAVAVISGLLVPGESVEQVARDFLAIFR